MHTLKRATIPAAALFTGLLVVAFATSGPATGQPPGKGKGAGSDKPEVANGHEQVRKNRSLPTEKSGLVFPVIKTHGGIVALPAAEEQPRKGAKVVFDVTGGADAMAVNPGLERAARLLNLYGAAGRTAKDVNIVVVLHGDATKAALGEAGFAKHFKAEKNPNLALLRDLDQAGVTVLVCGQSLHAKGFATDEVTRPARVAASAMTAVINRQADGYAYFPVR